MKMMTTIFIALFLLVPCGGEAKTLSPSTPADYAYALQTVNSFLWAWVNRDADTGKLLISHSLSLKLQKENNEGWFRDYMVGVSNPHHHSFEIGLGKTLNSNRMSFPVVLYELYTGEAKAFKYKSRIEVVLDGDSWKVDRLPITSGDK